ncbi:MAG: energy transducer TonB [Gammaproteobacteria bacterium]|nr:energy transducer TonB [Gammaproteobacteria bacterium]
MSTMGINLEPNFPWLESPEDRRFKWLVTACLVIFMGLGLGLNLLTLPEPEQRKLIDVSPRLAKLILEKKKIPPPPKKEIPKPEKKVKKKEPEKKKPEKKEKEPEKKKPSAREKAKQSGLLAEIDELQDLRDSFNLDDSMELPQKTTGKQALKLASSTALLTSQAKQTSGGITTSDLTRKVETSELTTRKTTAVSSSLESVQETKKTVTKQSRNSPSRSEEEIELVFQKNKGAIFSIYNRELRKDPSLEGKVVVELTIDPSGVVTQVKIISSELGNKSLEKKLVLKIKRFKFAKADVPQITVTYPIDFLPS